MWLTIVVAVAAGCTAAPADPRLVMASVPCLPPGMTAEFFSWPVVDLHHVTLHTEDGQEVDATWVLYRKRSAAVSAVWANSDLVAVDPKPESDEPYWIDGSLVGDDDDVLRAQPDGVCRWRLSKEST